MQVTVSHNTRLRNAILAMVELRRSNPRMTLNDIYAHLDVNRTDLNNWTNKAFGVTVAKYIKSILDDKPILPLKHFKVKHYVELTEKGLGMLIDAFSKNRCVTFSPNLIKTVAYGAINEADELCFEFAVSNDGVYNSTSRMIYTNYVLRDPTMFRIVPYTTPGVMLGIQNRNLGVEIY